MTSRLSTGRIAAALCVYAALLAGWWLATSVTGWIDPLRLPSPGDAVAALQQLVGTGYANGTLGTHLWETTRRVLIGFVLASSCGVLVGFAMGTNRRLDALLNPVIQLLRPIPPLAWIPLAILWFGLGATSKIFVVWLAVFTPAIINTYTGVRTVDPVLVSAARVHGARRRELVLDVVLPSALPMIFTGLRLSLQVAWMAVVAAELVGALSGLGQVMIIGTRDLNAPMILVAMAWVAVLGVLSTGLLAAMERWALRWRR